MAKRHDDTTISLKPLTFDEAIRELAKASKHEDSEAEGSDSTKEHAPESAPTEQ